MVGGLLIYFDSVRLAIVRQRPTGSIARGGVVNSGVLLSLPITFTPDELQRIRSLAPLPPTPDDPTNARSTSLQAARLGHYLFFDAGLSVNGEISCATCHTPTRWFTDGRQTAQALGAGTRNTPSLMNVAHQRWFTWDGRDDSLWSQGLEPLERDNEMGGNRVAIVRHVLRSPELKAAYEAVFGPLPNIDRKAGSQVPDEAKPIPDNPDHPLNVAWMAMSEADRERVTRAFVNVGKAIGAYERQLIDGMTPFDRFVTGLVEDGSASTNVLSPEELRGLRLFIGKAKCIRCHHGPTFTDNEFHNIGVPPLDGGLPRDPARYAGVELLKKSEFNAAGRFSDAPTSQVAILTEALVNSPENWGAFKTPSLRGVANTAPYMHAGQFELLEDVVRFYSTLEGAVQLDHHSETALDPLHLSEEEIQDLVAFLLTLRDVGPPDELLEPPPGPAGPLSN